MINKKGTIAGKEAGAEAVHYLIRLLCPFLSSSLLGSVSPVPGYCTLLPSTTLHIAWTAAPSVVMQCSWVPRLGSGHPCQHPPPPVPGHQEPTFFLSLDPPTAQYISSKYQLKMQENGTLFGKSQGCGVVNGVPRKVPMSKREGLQDPRVLAT